jgi:DNA-directed RNA polymerase subunit RPC12/RpoP
MTGFMYYCIDCKKLFKIGGADRKVKCPKCGKLLYDLKISDEEYAKLDKEEKEVVKKKAVELTEKEENNAQEQKLSEETISNVSQENVTIAKNNVKLKQTAAITSEQHATFNNVYLKTQIQGQILAADNFVSICKMSALKNDGVVDKDEDKLLKKVEKITGDYTKALKKLIS